MLLPFQLLAAVSDSEQTQEQLCKSTHYSLNQGWNLIGFGQRPNLTPQKLMGTIEGAISLWRYEDGKWFSLHPDQPSIDANPITEIVPGGGYWLRVSDSTTFQPVSSDEFWSGEYKGLKKGWNLLGVDQIKTPAQLLEKLESSSVWGWNGERWISYLSEVPEWLNSLSSLQCGKGYYLYSENGNNQPVAQAASFELDEDGHLAGALQGSDDDITVALTFQQVVAPQYGSLTLDASGSFTYYPEADYYGSDQFTFSVNDGIYNSTSATVSLTILAKPDPLRADNLTLSSGANSTVGGVLPGGDPDGGSVTYQISVQPSRGTVSIEPGGLFFYTPKSGESGGQDQFTYRISAGDRSASATVTVNLGSSQSQWGAMTWDQDNWE